MAMTNTVYKWEGDPTQPFRNNMTYRSKRWLLPTRTSFSAARVIGELGDRETYFAAVALRQEIIVRNQARIALLNLGGAIGELETGHGQFPIAGDLLEDVSAPLSYSGTLACSVKFYVDGVLKFTKNVYASDVPFRLNSGYRGRKFEAELVSNVKVNRFDMASSMEELKQ
jgi:hypothetical protein